MAAPTGRNILLYPDGEIRRSRLWGGAIAKRFHELELEAEELFYARGDLGAIEEAAREQLGWVRPGEERIIFVYESDDSTNEGD